VSDTADDKVVWLTQEQFDQLQLELDELSGPGRKEITRKIELARAEGDLKENGGYHAAREEQGKAEARIRQLIQMLRAAKVGEFADVSVAGPGMVVSLRWPGEDEIEKVLIGAREHGIEGVEIYSANSPLGKAVTGRKPGETVVYAAPNGREMTVELVEVEPYKR
jgi:transcription elongation factor GreA